MAAGFAQRGSRDGRGLRVAWQWSLTVDLDLNLSIPDLLAATAPAIDERIGALLPRRYDAAELAASFGGASEDYDAASLSEAISRPVWGYLDAGGKRWRPALMLVTGAAFGVAPERLLDLAALCEMMHNATLLVDDVEDDSPKRRGRDAAHVTFGVDVAVNAGNALYFIPLAALSRTANDMSDAVALAVHRIVAEEMTRLHYGQALDIAWRSGCRAPTVGWYMRMCAFKTGALARMAVRMAVTVASAERSAADAVAQYAESIGVAFQIQDDILNITPSALSEGKGFGEDIHEGKATLMVIHALANLPRDRADRLQAILREHTSDADTIRQAVAALEAAGSLEFARLKARELVTDAWSQASAALPKNRATDKLREFGEFVIARQV